MTLKRKILVGYGIIFTLMVIVFAWAIVNLVSLGKATNAILSENYRSILAAGNMIEMLERQDSAILLMASGEGRKGIAQFRENEVPFLEWLARAKDNITIEGEAELVRSIERAYVAYRQYFFALAEGHAIGESRLPPGEYQRNAFPLFEKVRSLCIELRTLNEKTMYTASFKAGSLSTRAIWSTAVVASVSLLLAFFFSLLLAERITRPIRNLMDASRKITSGDYDVQVPVQTGDEIGHLGNEFNAMTKQLKRYHEMNIDQLVSERNKGEAIISSIEDGLLLFDTNLVLSSLNPAARRMLDLEYTGNSTFRCLDILPGPKVCTLIEKMVDNNSVQIELPEEQRILSIPKSKEARHYLFTATPIHGKAGHHHGSHTLAARHHPPSGS
jgi:Signal transduction histidine kinase involved in nitrogen fixation and metabolism regulation